MPFFPHLRDAAGTAISGLARQASKLGGGAVWNKLGWFGYCVRAHDSLTGVLTQVEFLRRIEARRQSVQNAAVLVFDVDHLKPLNDVIGYVAVDACLVAMARLIAEDAEEAWVCRWGGDEFAVLVTDPTHAERIADRIRARMERSFLKERAAVIAEFPEFAERPVLTFSVGAAKLLPGLNLTQVLERCSEAVDAAKVAGQNCFRWAPQDSV